MTLDTLFLVSFAVAALAVEGAVVHAISLHDHLDAFDVEHSRRPWYARW